jgi:hypothetical protein
MKFFLLILCHFPEIEHWQKKTFSANACDIYTLVLFFIIYTCCQSNFCFQKILHLSTIAIKKDTWQLCIEFAHLTLTFQGQTLVGVNQHWKQYSKQNWVKFMAYFLGLQFKIFQHK